MTLRPSIRNHKLLRVLVCFFLSGAAGLVYQVAWAKALGLIFGHTVYAVATVLAVFMGGLAAGSAYLGRWAERRGDPIALYARIEFLIGLTGALSLLGLHGVHSLYLTAYPALNGWQPMLAGIRFFGAAVVLFIPTFLMGGTFPILIAGTAKNDAAFPLRVSQLYWVNTAGAVVGTLLAGFALLPTVGLALTICFAAALNGVAGLVALFVEKGDTTGGNDIPGREPPSARPLLWLFGIIGCTAFAYEIAWTRLLAVTIGSSTYAFTLMLATFLTGAVIGSALFQLFVSRPQWRLSLTTLCWAQTGIGASALSSLLLFHWIPAVIPPLLRATDRTFGGLVLTQAVTTALTVLPAAIVFGFDFPMIIALLDRKGSHAPGSSAAAGRAYAANTIGAIAGALLTGLWLIPTLGSFRVIASVAALNLTVALAIHLSSPQRRFGLVAIDGVLIVGAFLAASSALYNQSLFSLSAVLYGSSYQGRLTLDEIAATKDLVFAAEGVNDSVAVVRTDGDVALRINGKIDASTQDSRTQLLLGHLGAAFHGSPHRVLVIGFGSGMTVSAVARYPDVQRIDCIEIEPAVIRAAPYLQSLNRNVLNDPRVHVIFDDARNFLLASTQTYDLIISEPSNPWIAGIATLFTDEYYAAARQRLAPGGMFVQWVQAYSLAPADLRMIIATFAPHFPDVTLWRGGETDLLLLGRTDHSRFQFGHLQSLWQNADLRDDFTSMEIHQPEGLAAYFLLDDAAVRQLARGSRLNTDDRTLLEYDAPRSLLASDAIDFDQEIVARFRGAPLPPNMDPSEAGRALEDGLGTALDLNDPAGAKAFLKALESAPESATHDVAKGRLALMEGAIPDAKQFLEAALRLDPQSTEAAYWLAAADHRSGDDASAISIINKILESNPRFMPALEELMELSAARQDFQTALSVQLRRIALMPSPPAYEYGRLGVLLIKTSDFSKAEAVLLKGLAEDSYCYTCHFELGELYLRTSRLPLARQNFQWTVRFFPDTDAAAFRSLIAVDLMLGDKQSARAVLNEGLRVFPEDTVLLKTQAALNTH